MRRFPAKTANPSGSQTPRHYWVSEICDAVVLSDPTEYRKLYDLMDAHRKKTGARINQQDLLRRLVEVADINTLLP
jgi:hypothetical protein